MTHFDQQHQYVNGIQYNAENINFYTTPPDLALLDQVNAASARDQASLSGLPRTYTPFFQDLSNASLGSPYMPHHGHNNHHHQHAQHSPYGCTDTSYLS